MTAQSAAAGVTPRVRVDLGRLLANAELAAAERPLSSIAVDLTADAWGHGAQEVEKRLRRAGVRRFVTGRRSESDTLDPADVYGQRSDGGRARPVLRMEAMVLLVKQLRAGEGVSYGYDHRAEHDTRIALVSAGYAHGVMRSLGGRADVSIDGVRHPIIGRIAMDACVIDVGTAPVERGATAVLLGDPERAEPTLAEWFQPTGETAAALLAAVGSRARREYQG